MKSNQTDESHEAVGIISIFIIWIICVAISIFAGHFGGYLAGMRIGPWNLFSLYPAAIGGLVSLVSYPILAISIRSASAGNDKDKGVFSALLIAVSFAFLAGFLFVKSNG